MVDQQPRPEQPSRQCQHCGHIGTDVHLESGYVGGGYYRDYWKCDDNAACWDRWAAPYLADHSNEAA